MNHPLFKLFVGKCDMKLWMVDRQCMYILIYLTTKAVYILGSTYVFKATDLRRACIKSSMWNLGDIRQGNSQGCKKAVKVCSVCIPNLVSYSVFPSSSQEWSRIFL